MASSNIIHVVGCHAEGEVGDVIVSGVSPPPGETIWEQSRFIDQDNTLRNFVLNEPRGGVFRHVNLLVPPKHPEAQAAFIIMEPADTPPMSGSNCMCVATVLLETDILPMQELITELILEAPGGLVKVRAECEGGKVKNVTIRNVPSFACLLDQKLEVAGLGTLDVDTAFGGDSFVFVSASELGFNLTPDEARDIAETGMKITAAATEQIGFQHPTNPDWTHFSFTSVAKPIEMIKGERVTQNAVAIRPGKIDRSPTGTGVSARLAIEHARGNMKVGDHMRVKSIIGSEFVGRVGVETMVGERAAICPWITGRTWITGTSQLRLDPDDPWPEGYRLNDTWPSPTKYTATKKSKKA